jgi:aldehyde dehydrogenase (NAD+)
VNKYQDLFHQQNRFFNGGDTLPLKTRTDAIRSIGNELRKQGKQISEAVYEDLHKSDLELLTTEISGILHEIKWVSSKLRRWTRPGKVRTNLVNIPARSRILLEPYGQTLIIGTWNYPFLLNVKPAVSALAAGNTVIIKPSEHSPHSSAMIRSVISAAVSPQHCSVVLGGIPDISELLELPFDKIFFTGSTAVGQLVMTAAARHLSSLTLELGGKSPAIVLPDAALAVAARRIVWGKFLNAGQTCIAPDYVLVHESVAGQLVDLMAGQILAMFGKDPSKSGSYGRIVDQRHFDRLVSLIDIQKTVTGGMHNREELYISPTVIYPAGFSDPVMQEEIFGPVLPVIPFRSLPEMVTRIKSMPKPLALYLFSQSASEQKNILSSISFGGGCVNDTVMHIANPYLPFGGVGPSGTGRYHGKAGIYEFSNRKSILYKSTWIDPSVRYPPFGAIKEKILRKLL